MRSCVMDGRISILIEAMKNLTKGDYVMSFSPKNNSFRNIACEFILA